MHQQAREELKVLYPEWKRFCEASGEPVLSEKTFSQKLEGQNLIKTKDLRSRRVCFRGLRLRPNSMSPKHGFHLQMLPSSVGMPEQTIIA